MFLKVVSMVVIQRRRRKTEEKAAAWGADLIHFFAPLAVLHQVDLKNRMNCTRTIGSIG